MNEIVFQAGASIMVPHHCALLVVFFCLQCEQAFERYFSREGAGFFHGIGLQPALIVGVWDVLTYLPR